MDIHVGGTARWLAGSDLDEWDRFVISHPCGSVYHLLNWKRALERAFSHIEGRFLVVRECTSGAIVAGIPLYIVRSWLFGTRIVSIPFASMCDPLISSPEQMDILLPAIYALQKETLSRDIEIRAVRTREWISDKGASASCVYRHHYIPLMKSPEELSKGFARTVLRGIERAQKQGVRIIERNDDLGVRIFYRVFLQTRKRLNLPPIPIRFFNSLATSFDEDQMTILLAVLDDKVVGGMLMLKFNGVYHAEYSGNTPAGDQTGANKLLYWEAIRHAHRACCRSLSLGRTSLLNPGLMQFKRFWAPIEEPISVLHLSAKGKSGKHGLEGARENKAARWVFGHAPLQVCRLLGSLIYRHHG